MIFTWKGGVMTVAAGIEVAVAVLSEFVMVTAKQQQQQQQQQQQTKNEGGVLSMTGQKLASVASL